MLNKDILTMYNGLMGLASDPEARLPAKVSFAIMRNIRNLSPIVEDIETTRRQIIVDHGGVPVGDDQMQIQHDQIDDCQRCFDELGNMDVDIALMKIKFEDIESLNLSIPMAQALEFMLEEGI